MLKPGWFDRQIEVDEEEMKNWPAWTKREARLEDLIKSSEDQSTVDV